MGARIGIIVVCTSIALSGCERSPDSPADVLDCPGPNPAGVIEIAEGLTATVRKKGHGRAAGENDYVDVHTTLWLYDESADDGRGEEIWSSGGREPFQIQLGLGQVIKGWDLGVPCMLVGETRELIVAANLAYGASGRDAIPPDATLLFSIELVKVKAPSQ